MAAQTAGKVCSHHQKIKPSLQVKKDDIAFPLALGRNFLLHPFSPTHEGHPLERPLTSIRWNPAESHLLKKKYLHLCLAKYLPFLTFHDNCMGTFAKPLVEFSSFPFLFSQRLLLRHSRVTWQFFSINNFTGAKP